MEAVTTTTTKNSFDVSKLLEATVNLSWQHSQTVKQSEAAKVRIEFQTEGLSGYWECWKWVEVDTSTLEIVAQGDGNGYKSPESAVIVDGVLWSDKKYLAKHLASIEAEAAEKAAAEKDKAEKEAADKAWREKCAADQAKRDAERAERATRKKVTAEPVQAAREETPARTRSRSRWADYTSDLESH